MSEAYIFVQLMAGLGNQLFQYAAGMLQAKIMNGTLLLCKAIKNHHSNKDYRDIIMNKGVKYDNTLPPHISFYQEDAFKAWNPYEYKYPILYMYGYFQNYKSLEPILNEFRENILSQIKYQRSIVSKQYAIKEGDAFIHIRRGDYVTNTNIHHLQDLEYYSKAIYILKETGSVKRWFIFSDDMKWCKEQDLFKQLEPIFIEEPDEVYTLAIMSEITSGAIIANSSFSWMGAFLGVGTDKKNSVIYPTKWFKNTTPDLFPNSWIGI